MPRPEVKVVLCARSRWTEGKRSGSRVGGGHRRCPLGDSESTWWLARREGRSSAGVACPPSTFIYPRWDLDPGPGPQVCQILKERDGGPGYGAMSSQCPLFFFSALPSIPTLCSNHGILLGERISLSSHFLPTAL